MLRWIGFYCFLAIAPAALGADASREREAVLATIDALFAALAAKDADALGGLLLPGGMTYTQVHQSDGIVRLHGRSNREQIEQLGRSRDRIDERYRDPTVLVHESIAVVWTPYEFHLNGKLVHCGVDVFELLKVSGVWRIGNAMWTAEPAGCNPLSASAAQGPKRVIYRGATLIDGTGAPARRDSAVVVENERIAAVLPAAEIGDRYVDAAVIDVRGLYVLPGLIDTHVHLATAPDRRYAEGVLRRQLYSGVTAVRDMAGDTRALADLSRAALLAEIPAPDIYYAALMAGPSFFTDPRTAMSTRGVGAGAAPWMQAITAQTDLPLAVAAARGTGASAIKVYADLPAALVAAIVAEAHRQGMPVWAHAAVFPATPEQVVEAGVDVVSHGCLLAYQISDRPRQSIADRVSIDYGAIARGNDQIIALLRKMRDRGVILDATTSLVAAGIEKQAAANPNAPPPPCTGAIAATLAAQAHREGVPIATGTDYETPWPQAYPALHDELEMLADRAGLSPAEVIKAATSVAARALGQQANLGTIQAGKRADLVFVAKDPLQSIHNLRSVELTVKRGAIYRRAEYQPLAPDEGPASGR